MSNRFTERPRRVSIDLHVTSAVKREVVYSGSDALDPPYGPTTPNGHPLSNPFQNLIKRRSQPTPLPVLKILPLCIARMAEGLIFAVIFPYINEMMHDMGVPEESVGLWSATAESTLMVTEALAAPFFAPIADKVGRRPVFIPLVFLWGVFSVAFGFATTPLSAVFLRACLGLLAGVGVLSRTMLGELCDKSNRVQGFAFFSPALTLGVTIAPLVGGFLSRPVPRLFPPSFTLLVEHPYLLPSVVGGMVGFASAISAHKFLPETLPPSMRKSSAQTNAMGKADSGGFRALMRYPRFQNMLALYALSNLVMFSWEAIFPLFAFTGKDLGGLGLSTPQIGVILAVSAGLSIAMTSIVFPRLHKRIPENDLLRFSVTMYPLAVALFPIMWGMSAHLPAGELSGISMLALGIQMLMRRTGDFAATMLDASVLDAIPGPEYLATANSITFSIAGVGRAVGPFIVSSVFALSTSASSAVSIRRQLVWLVFALVSLPSVYVARQLSDPPVRSEEEKSEMGLNDIALDD
ncbi:hypothetical protein CspeluHIS016_0901530 [Cutaneotrichosporon spelunceum]|uniref:Major facilitator superfamily (MFS) profile domain-containing protein n=1 Tax=Cutaneotrichosporon spelunceum TaxID=1672016 RepID=A0AAD3TZV4_9TREE|nr:hypothetical protein CspeluHIS016_0901530 [Cutaneotrichosporon spelunceum]